MTKKYERTCGLCGDDFLANTWNSKFCKKEECQKFSKYDAEQRKLYLKKLKGEYKTTCSNCGKDFIPKSMNQKYCTIDCRTEANRKRKRNGNGKKNLSPKEKILEKTNGESKLNGINSEYKLITKWKNLAEDVLRVMNPNKLSKYSKQTQDFCLEIRNELLKQLKNQTRGKGVIIVNFED
jgi:hypothetical protein